MNDKEMKPVYICLTCKKVIGPIWDDDKNQCGCGPYDYEVVRVAPVDEIEQLKSENDRLRCCGNCEEYGGTMNKTSSTVKEIKKCGFKPFKKQRGFLRKAIKQLNR